MKCSIWTALWKVLKSAKISNLLFENFFQNFFYDMKKKPIWDVTSIDDTS